MASLSLGARHGFSAGTRKSRMICGLHIITNSNFIWEMRRFLPPQVVSDTIENGAFWEYLTDLIRTECDHVIHKLAKS